MNIDFHDPVKQNETFICDVMKEIESLLEEVNDRFILIDSLSIDFIIGYGIFMLYI